MSHNVYSQVNIPFSWEIKPGVSKVTHEEASIDIRHVTLNLPPPPSLSKSARFCAYDSQGVLLPPSPKTSGSRKGNKLEDPFVAAYRKCTECYISGRGKLGTEHKNDACRTRKKNMFILSCKYSCSVSGNNMVRVSRCLKEKAKEEQKQKQKGGVMQN